MQFVFETAGTPMSKMWLVRLTGALVVAVAIGWMLYATFGHRLINSLYTSHSPGFFSMFMEGRDRTPVQNYYREADRLMWAATARVVTLFVIFAVINILLISRLLLQAGLIIASMLLGHFLIFCVIERNPSIIRSTL